MNVRSALLVSALVAPLLLAGCTGEDKPETVDDADLRTAVEKARDAVEKALEDNPDLKPRQLTPALMRKHGHTNTERVVTTVAAGRGMYCVYVVRFEDDTEYGITAKKVWFADSSQDELRQAPVPKLAITPDWPSGPCEDLNLFKGISHRG